MNTPIQRKTSFMRVFVGPGGAGGNPAAVVLDAAGMSEDEMRWFAAEKGYECGFVQRAAETSAPADFSMRYFVPEHEMEMCGHATVGALWALRRAGLWKADRATFATKSGVVQAFVRHAGAGDEVIEITQPQGRLKAIEREADIVEILRALAIEREQVRPLPILNAATSRVKTLVPLKSVDVLDALRPDFSRMKQVCERIGSTGLYPFAIESLPQRVFHARQFPKASGYQEDPATGIAAAAMLYGLRAYGLVGADERVVTVHQGTAMGSPSIIHARFNGNDGCLVGGQVVENVTAVW